MKKKLLALMLAVSMVLSTPITVEASEVATAEVATEQTADTAEGAAIVEEAAQEKADSEESESPSTDDTKASEKTTEELSEEVTEADSVEELELVEEEETELLEASDDEEPMFYVTMEHVEYTEWEENSFSSWNATLNYINQYNKKWDCTVCISDGTEINDFKLPSKLHSLTIKGNGSTIINPAKLKLKSNIILNSDVIIDGVEFVPLGKNHTINLNNHKLTIENSQNWRAYDIKGAGANSELSSNSVELGNVDISRLSNNGGYSDFFFKSIANIGSCHFSTDVGFWFYENGALNIKNDIVTENEYECDCYISILKFGSDNKMVEIADGDLLFTVNGKANTNNININQPKGIKNELIAYQDGNKVLAGDNGFEIIDNSDSEKVYTTSSWGGVLTLLEKYGNSNSEYTVKVSKDFTLKNLPSPKVCSNIIFKGSSNKEVTLPNNFALTNNVRFEEINIEGNTDALKLNITNYNISFNAVNFKQPFSAITSSGKGKLIIEDSVVVSNGAISVANLDMSCSELLSKNAGITVSGDTNMEFSSIEVKNSATFKNLDAANEENNITYGTTYKDKLTITGEVNGEGTHYPFNILPGFITKDDYKNAADYYGKNIVFSKKAAACYFVIGRESDGITTSVKYQMKRVKDALQINMDTAEGTVELFEDGMSWGLYKNLKSALDAISLSGSKNKEFTIAIIDANATNPKENIVIPANAKLIKIHPANEGKILFNFNNKITLNTDLTLENLEFNDINVKNSKTSSGAKNNLTGTADIILNGNALVLDNTKVSIGRIRSITGNGVYGTSKLTLSNSGDIQDKMGYFAVMKDLNNVGTVSFIDSSLAVFGKTNIGNVECYANKPCMFIGSATVTTKKVKSEKVATKIASNICIANHIEPSYCDENKGPALVFSLVYKTKNNYGYVGYTEGGIYDSYDKSILNNSKPAYEVIKAPRASVGNFIYYDEILNKSDSFTGAIYKKNGSCYYVDGDYVDHNYSLREMISETEYRPIADFDTYNEAIDAINAAKNPDAVYAINKIIEDEENAVKFVTPKKGCAKKLIFTSERAFRFKDSNITLNCDTVFDSAEVNLPGAATFNIGTYSLEIKDSSFNNDIKKIVGAGENKKGKNNKVSCFEYRGQELSLTDIVGVGEFIVGGNVTVYGKTSVGILHFTDNVDVFTGSANVNTSGRTLTSITTNITVKNKIIDDNPDREIYLSQMYIYKKNIIESISDLEYDYGLNISKLYKSKNPIHQLLKTDKIKYVPGEFNGFAIGDNVVRKKVGSSYIYYNDYYEPDYYDEW